MAAVIEELFFKDQESWRNWLMRNNEVAKGIWIIYYKKHTQIPSLHYNEAVEQAICFGWIDSIIKRIDDDRYMQKFTPRNPKSTWSPTNIMRAKRMLDLGLMQESGIKVLPKNLEVVTPKSKISNDKTPDFIKKILIENPIAYGNLHKHPPSLRRNLLGWICSAKKEETRINRLREVINKLNRGEKFGLK